LRERGGLVLACDNGLFAFEPETAKQTFLVDPEPNMPGHRKNDGRVDANGNFWIGTLREHDYAPVGAIYRIAADMTVTTEVTSLAIPNSLAFDAERKRMYFADTRAYEIWNCDYNSASGVRGNKMTFARTAAPARPDGSCIDAEGFLWNAEYGGSRVVCYSPNGQIARVVELPVTFPTCCCFGGYDLDRLYITSASEPLSVAERMTAPLAGRVLMLKPGVNGRQEYRAAF
jgi:sugar lactone lactonase YvrE